MSKSISTTVTSQVWAYVGSPDPRHGGDLSVSLEVFKTKADADTMLKYRGYGSVFPVDVRTVTEYNGKVLYTW